MKKIYISALAVALAVFASSCNKEVEMIDTPENGTEELVKISINGKLDKEIAKTAYTEDGKMTWVEGDRVALIVSKGDNYSNQNRNQYLLEAGGLTEEGRNATFTGLVPYHQDGTKEWLSSGIAVYPVAFSQINSGNYYNAPFIKIPSSVDGLASSIALIGLADNDVRTDVTTFKFNTAMSVLKVNITNIPAEATSIRLTTSDSNNYPVDGDFTLVKSGDIVTVGIANYKGWANGYQAVDISSEGAISSRDFFFNVPVNTYPANTLSIEVRNGNDVLMKRTIAKELVLSRNDCLAIPTLCYHSVNVKGTVDHPKLYTVKPSSANTIRVNISSEKLTSGNYNSNNWVNGNRFGADQSGWDLTNLKNASSVAYLSTSGTYYLQYIVSSDGSIPSSLSHSSVMAYGSVPFRFDSDGSSFNDISEITGSYSVNAVEYYDNKSTTSFTIAVSDDSSKGNVMITQILGHNTSIYGTYQNGTISFNEDQEWYVDGNGATHKLINNWNGTTTSTWSLKISASFDLDLALGTSYLVNEWFKGENHGYDNIYKVFDSKKQ